jgi:hypothetical protein
MKRTYPISLISNPLEVLRKAGYSYFKDPQSGEESFIIRLTPEFYPRFHLYVEGSHEDVTFSLHLDQKKASYGDGAQHSGEYEGPVIEKEMKRIDGWVQAVSRQNSGNTAEHDIDNRNKKQQKQQAGILSRFWISIFGERRANRNDRIER